MDRRCFLKTVSAGVLAGSTGGTDAAKQTPAVAALPQVQYQPLPELGSHWTNVFEKLSARCKPKMSFLNDEFDDPASWAESARATLLADFHYSPLACDPKPELIERADRGTHLRERLFINTTPDIRIPVYVLIPKDLHEPAPAVVALHDHGGFYFWGKEKLVQVEPEHPVLSAFKERKYGGRSVADELARRGFVVIVPDMLHCGERGMYLQDDPERIRNRTIAVTADDIKQFNARSWAHEELVSRTALTCGATWSGMIVWDDMRVTDYLLTRPEVDRTRVGCVGLSVGSVRSIFLGALHPAVRAAVAVCWMAKYQMMAKFRVRNGVGFTKLVPGLYTDLDWPDLAGLHWPGALMTINGLRDAVFPLEATQQAVEQVNAIFAKMGSPEKYEGVFFDGPHEFNVEMQERAFNWLSRQLRES